jgi:hypothetical protein
MLGLSYALWSHLLGITSWLLASLVAVSISFLSLASDAQNRLVRALPDPENRSFCTLIGPAKDPRWRKTPGLEQSDLSLFAKTSATHAPLVARYLSGASRVGSSKYPRLAKSDECAFMDRLAIALNDAFYGVPTMECRGTPFIYRFRPLGFNVEMDTILMATSQGRVQRVVSHEWMNLTNTGNKRNGCLIRVTQAKPNQKQFKICLPGLGSGPGRVAMLYEGQNLPSESMNILCAAEPGFEGVVKDLVSEGVTPSAQPGHQPNYRTEYQPQFQPSSDGSGEDSGETAGGGRYSVY